METPCTDCAVRTPRERPPWRSRPVEYEDMTKAELEELLVARDLPKTGNKDELIARLQEDDG